MIVLCMCCLSDVIKNNNNNNNNSYTECSYVIKFDSISGSHVARQDCNPQFDKCSYEISTKWRRQHEYRV